MPQQIKFKNFFQKMETPQKKRKRLNKKKFKSFFQKMETPQKKRKRLNKKKFKSFFQKTETPQKKEETHKQNKVLKLFSKKRKRLKIKRGNTSTLNIRKRLKNIRKSLKIFPF